MAPAGVRIGTINITEDGKGKSGKEGLLYWCQKQTEPYKEKGVRVTNFTSRCKQAPTVPMVANGLQLKKKVHMAIHFRSHRCSRPPMCFMKKKTTKSRQLLPKSANGAQKALTVGVWVCVH